MYPFGNQYDIWIVDYKVVIKENLNYNRGGVCFWGFIILGITLLSLYNDDDPSFVKGVLITVIELAIILGIYISRKPNGIIEIDNDRKTIRVRDKYDINRESVICLKISDLKGRDGYLHDYLSLVCDSETETGIYKIIRGNLGNEETARIARLLADKLKLELIVEQKEPFSFRKMFSAKKEKEESQKAEVVY